MIYRGLNGMDIKGKVTISKFGCCPIDHIRGRNGFRVEERPGIFFSWSIDLFNLKVAYSLAVGFVC